MYLYGVCVLLHCIHLNIPIVAGIIDIIINTSALLIILLLFYAYLCRYGYMRKVLGVAVLYEIVVTVLDYQFKLMGADSVSSRNNKDTTGENIISENPNTISYLDAYGVHDSNYFIVGDPSTNPAGDLAGEFVDNISDGDAFANLLGHFGQVTNLISFFVSFLGFSYLVHVLGVRRSLLIYPITMFVAVVIAYLVPHLWVLFVVVSVLKAMIFSLQDPVKELLYIPTSEPIKYKAKVIYSTFLCYLISLHVLFDI